MTSRTSVAVAAASILLVGLATHTSTQSAAEIGDRPLTHMAVVVRDIDASARAWADVLGLPVPKTVTAAIPLGDRKSPLKVVFFYLPNNFYIELNEPADDANPWREHLEKYGPGPHHIGFTVDGMEAKIARLEKVGGTFVAGAPGGRFAFLDFRQRLGATFELVVPATTAPPPRPVGTGILATTPVNHVGIAAANVDDVSKSFAEALGIAAPEVRQGKPGSIAFPPGSSWNPDAHVRSAIIQLQENKRIEMLQPIGSPSPWADYIGKQRGTALHHIAWNVGDKLADTVQFLQSKGGKWTNGGPGSSYAYLDFMDSPLGVVIEVTGTRP